MVTTSASRSYTELALRTFFAHTPLGAADRFLLIDNEGDDAFAARLGERGELVRNSAPRSFAANMNAALERADRTQASLFFLNNDLAFTPHWLDALLLDERSILSPLSNAEIPYEVRGHRLGFVLDFDDYDEQVLLDAAAFHRSRTSGFRRVPTFPFFCVKIPPSVYSVLGPLDESFGSGGAEDRDYALRAYRHGFDLCYALASYVLHFQGKSTWRGAETAAETAARDREYLAAFRAKWGEALTAVFVLGRTEELAARGLLEEWKKGRFHEVIEKLLRGA